MPTSVRQVNLPPIHVNGRNGYRRHARIEDGRFVYLGPKDEQPTFDFERPVVILDKIDLALLKEQQASLAEALHYFRTGDTPDSPTVWEAIPEAIEGVLNLMGAVRDALDPPPV